ncbi:hypothetical protein [Burkholderia cenocepacia]|uniref:hypothetical protein n=1 Tax=Burkholderia cenocepacia TaxID=95486 RepID=UPI000F588492|nr:hypothetical protein [Burkholderia cenocepacia]
MRIESTKNNDMMVRQIGIEKFLFLKGRALSDFDLLDREICGNISSKHDVCFHNSDIVIERSNLEDVGFFDKIPAIPYEITHIEFGLHVDKKSSSLIINPSACYHCFMLMKQGFIPCSQGIYSTKAFCKRHENTEHSNPFRLTSFSMREFVIVGEEEYIREQANLIFDQVEIQISSMVSNTSRSVASDSFMGQNADMYKRYQKAMELKTELVYEYKNFTIALASINWHQKTMINSFVDKDNHKHKSACVAIGLDRLFLAKTISEETL